MDGSHGNGNDTLYRNDYTTVTGTFHFQENTLLPFEITTCNTHFGALRQVKFFRLKVQEMIVISTGNSNEALHLVVGDDNLLTATGVGDVLQIGNLGLDTL